MQSHGPKRVYTPQSLEFWFNRLEQDWADRFSETQLEEGRRIYRDGEIRELELTAKDATIHRRIEKRDEYSVIEWEGGVINVRSSATDQDLAHAIAVAGLHEIEELVADEISPLPEEPLPSARANGANGHGTSAPASAAVAAPPLTATTPLVSHAAPRRRGLAVASGTAPPALVGGAGPAPPATPVVRGRAVLADTITRTPSRQLILAFETRPEGLAFQAWWQADEKRTPALGSSAAAAAAGAASPSERAKLIGLAAYARKAHFHFNQESGLYVLETLKEIPQFLKSVLPAWERLFKIELDARAANLAHGPRAVEIEAVASRGGRTGRGANSTAAGASNGGTLNLRWIFRAGEKLLDDTAVELLLRRGGQPTILPDIGIVSVPTERLETLHAWQRNVAETDAAGELSPYLLFSLFSDQRLKVSLSADLEAWRQSVLSPSARPPALPELLRPYQRRGVEWLHHLAEVGCHCLLADEMGLGKTMQVLSLLAARPVAERPSLIVCPASVVPVWREEAAKFFPQLKIEVLKAGHDFVVHREPALWLASYTQLRKHRGVLDQAEFGYAVLDEGQFIKNPDAKVTQSCFALRARHRIVLTGTPLENRQLDLWSIFRYLLPGLLGSRASFEAQLHSDRPGTLGRLRAQLAPFILRRTKNEVAKELPPKVEMDLLCPLTDLQRAEYARICTEGLERFGTDMQAALRDKSFGLLALLTRLRQACCDPDLLPWLRAPLTESGKLNLLVEKLAEIVGSGHKVVIFSQFVMLLDRVRELLSIHYPDLPRYELTGMTLDRLKPVQGFQGAQGAAVMLVSLKAAGTGITLHAADYVFLLDPWWNPAVEAQAVDRVHRLGQTNTVFVYRMVTAGTIEERIQALKASKKDLFDKLIGGLGGDVDLSQHFDSLQDLIQLSAAASDSAEGAA